MKTGRLLQRFELLEQIGDGGMGTVYRAHDPQLDRDVAIKVLKDSSAAARDALATHRTLDLRAPASDAGLLEEARMMARLSHPNVVPIYEVGLADDGLFVVMEYVDGRDLRAWLATRPSPAAIRAVFAQAARGLAAAHDRGIVHRDFKPDNVLIGSDGRARVTDFGLARLGEPAAYVRKASVAGTPKYMAPELWRGEPPTPACDVFAFAASLREALGGDTAALEEPLRSLLAAASADDPDARPSIGELVAALDGIGARRRRFPRAVVGVAAVAVIGAGAAIAVAMASDDSAGCTEDTGAVARHWDAAARERVRGALGDETVALADKRAHELVELRRATCEAARRGELASAQHARQMACLDRRAIELGAIADAQVSDKLPLVHAEALLNRAPLAASCAELVMAPPTADEPALRALYGRLARTYPPRGAAEVVDELAAIEKTARAAGDLELAARAAVVLGGRQRQLDRAKESDATLQRAYNEALAIHSDDTAASALIERILTVVNAGDVSAAKMLVTLASDLGRKPTVSPRTRLRLQYVIGRDLLVRGDYARALETLRAALDDAAASGQRNADIVLITQMDLVDAMALHGGKARHDAIAVGERTIELAREVSGERSHNYGYAHTLLAKVYMLQNRHADSLRHRRKAVEVQQALYAPDHSHVIEMRGELGLSLAAAGDVAGAERELAEVVELARKNPTMQRLYGFLLANYANAVAAIGRHADAIEHYERALQHLTSTHGPDHPQTVGHRFRYAAVLLESGRLDEVERQVKLLEESYARKPRARDARGAETRGTYLAGVALARGRGAEAEAIARRALAELVELGASPGDQRFVQLRLGEALIAQRKYAEARPILETGLATARTIVSRADDLGRYEVALARVELELGERAAAIARANDLRARIEPYPGALGIRAALAKLPAK